MAEPRFHREDGRQTQLVQTLVLANISEKLHENEENLTERENSTETQSKETVNRNMTRAMTLCPTH